jgi:hypothetical protein
MIIIIIIIIVILIVFLRDIVCVRNICINTLDKGDSGDDDDDDNNNNNNNKCHLEAM